MITYYCIRDDYSKLYQKRLFKTVSEMIIQNCIINDYT